MNGEGRKKGIKGYSDLSITKEDIVLPYFQGNTIRDERLIHRAQKLTKEILEIWKM